MNNNLKKLKYNLIPIYSIIPLIICFGVNSIIYWGTQIIMADRYHYDFTSEFDRKIPFVKEWVVIYLICYIFWIVNYILSVRESRKDCFRFVTADLISRIICCIFFICVPTTNVRPVVYGNDIFSILMRFVYDMDSPTNLFPSIHCLVSWFCFIGIRNSKKVRKSYKVFSCIFAILVCLSTQFTKQHYIVDVFAGIFIAEVCFYISGRLDLGYYTDRIFTCLYKKIGIIKRN